MLKAAPDQQRLYSVVLGVSVRRVGSPSALGSMLRGSAPNDSLRLSALAYVR
jgi:hypothetical protein